MFDQINEQFKESLKPVTELATLNMTTLQSLAEKQNALFTSLLAGGASFAETASQQKDVMSLAEAQKAYLETLQETITESAKETYTLVSGAQQKAGAMMKDISEEVTSKLTAAAK
ncbi:phasin family protein [Glaciecola petra]|uniref:Phasin family protein n=1 Tax=Glaciecola petra TaxID=3075602 RepID=A0ABU2ZSJ7_9ALTE|nr:phasin family protein [Aestuariibacter sp. P117]MDT0595607.1 phasin family protein [Aestuariibacter sp. P117]